MVVPYHLHVIIFRQRNNLHVYVCIKSVIRTVFQHPAYLEDHSSLIQEAGIRRSWNLEKRKKKEKPIRLGVHFRAKTQRKLKTRDKISLNMKKMIYKIK